MRSIFGFIKYYYIFFANWCELAYNYICSIMSLISTTFYFKLWNDIILKACFAKVSYEVKGS